MNDFRVLHVSANGADQASFDYAHPGSLREGIRRAAHGPGRTTIYLHDGVYRLRTPLRLGPELANVEFRALTPGRAVLDGGLPLPGWREVLHGGRKLLAADASAVLAVNPDMRFLFINGQRKTSCRYPASGSLKAEISDTRASFPVPESLVGLRELEPLELVLNYDWVCRRLKIQQIDPGGIAFVPDQIRKHKAANLHLEKLPVAFLSPGQWTLDQAAKTVYYMPEAGESPAEMDAATGFLPVILDIRGELEAGRYVENLLFDGIEFRHSGDARLVNSSQADCDCSAAVYLTAALNCRFENCAFTHTSGWGLELDAGCRGTTVAQCRFTDLGAGGIKANGATQTGSPGVTGNCSFTHNTICEGGRFWSSAVGILTRHSAGNLIQGNDISLLHYTGISCGWVWGYAESISRDNLILDNHIHHLGSECLLVDLGAIYTLGRQPGSVIRGNIIHDICGDLISWGIYLDEGSSDFLVEQNLVYNIRSECFHLHYGRRNLVRDNVFGFGGKEGVCSVTRGTMGFDLKFTRGDLAMRLEGNILVSRGEPFITKYILDYAEKEDLTCIESDRNLLQGLTEVPVLVADGFHIFEHSYRVKLGEQELRADGRLEKNSRYICSPTPLPAAECARLVSPQAERLYRELCRDARPEKVSAWA